jgi:NIMA (never in mitosis gene a)-related kinase
MAAAYDVLRELGHGSYGTAELARKRRCTGEQQLSVLKKIDISQMPPTAFAEARKEVDVLKSLQHVNIVAYHDTFVESGRLYIVMEYADGGNLADSIRWHSEHGEKFTEEKALSIFSQSCLALQHIHAKHILHRDLKSENIFLMKDGCVKLGDFGIAKMLDTTGARAMTVIGTPSYLAPEVCDSQPYGTKADIWSLGVVLYEVLMLELPFKARSLAALVVKIVTVKPEPLPLDVCSEDTQKLVRRLLRKKPEKRPSVGEILALPIIMRTTSAIDMALESAVSTRATSRNSSSSAATSRSTSKDSSCSREVHGNRDQVVVECDVSRPEPGPPVVPSAVHLPRLLGTKRFSLQPGKSPPPLAAAHKLAKKVQIHDGVGESLRVAASDMQMDEPERTLSPKIQDSISDSALPGLCNRRRFANQLAHQLGVLETEINPLPKSVQKAAQQESLSARSCRSSSPQPDSSLDRQVTSPCLFAVGVAMEIDMNPAQKLKQKSRQLVPHQAKKARSQSPRTGHSCERRVSSPCRVGAGRYRRQSPPLPPHYHKQASLKPLISPPGYGIGRDMVSSTRPPRRLSALPHDMQAKLNSPNERAVGKEVSASGRRSSSKLATQRASSTPATPVSRQPRKQSSRRLSSLGLSGESFEARSCLT